MGTSKNNIKNIKDEIKLIRQALKKLEDIEVIQSSCRNNKEYYEAQQEAQDTIGSMMKSLKVMVDETSSLGHLHCKYEYFEDHKIVKYIL